MSVIARRAVAIQPLDRLGALGGSASLTTLSRSKGLSKRMDYFVGRLDRTPHNDKGVFAKYVGGALRPDGMRSTSAGSGHEAPPTVAETGGSDFCNTP